MPPQPSPNQRASILSLMQRERPTDWAIPAVNTPELYVWERPARCQSQSGCGAARRAAKLSGEPSRTDSPHHGDVNGQGQHEEDERHLIRQVRVHGTALEVDIEGTRLNAVVRTLPPLNLNGVGSNAEDYWRPQSWPNLGESTRCTVASRNPLCSFEINASHVIKKSDAANDNTTESALGDSSMDDRRRMRVVIISPGFSGVIAGARLPSVELSLLNACIDRSTFRAPGADICAYIQRAAAKHDPARFPELQQGLQSARWDARGGPARSTARCCTAPGRAAQTRSRCARPSASLSGSLEAKIVGHGQDARTGGL
ncbi:hypothetical protein BC834DRAFT_840902 [Gloeopeniophorella convolvens]|nr:hypothetical protein BC834DRAFT_840902 [Gloeopeniophorella convolvens]